MQQEGKWVKEDGHGLTKIEIFEVLWLQSIQNEPTLVHQSKNE